MKERLVELIDKTEEIQRLFHRIEGRGIPTIDEIRDVQGFKDWKAEILFEIQSLPKRDTYIDGLQVFLENPKVFAGWKDKDDFAELKSKLYVIRKNIDSYYEGGSFVVSKKPTKIFISHSSKDKEYVASFVNLLDGMGLTNREIFCSSLPGYGIPTSQNIYEYLRQMFLEYELHVILMHSTNYYESTVSMNEMGAAWVTKNRHTSVLLPGNDFSIMQGVVNSSEISIKLDGDIDEVRHRLNELYDELIYEFGLEKKADIIWEKKRNSFIEDVCKIASNSTSVLGDSAFELLKKAAGDVNGQILKVSDLSSGTRIQSGGEVMNKVATARESARWIAALEELIQFGYVASVGTQGTVFQVTETGYKATE